MIYAGPPKVRFTAFTVSDVVTDNTVRIRCKTLGCRTDGTDILIDAKKLTCGQPPCDLLGMTAAAEGTVCINTRGIDGKAVNTFRAHDGIMGKSRIGYLCLKDICHGASPLKSIKRVFLRIEAYKFIIILYLI